jgi:hypothetical protein
MCRRRHDQKTARLDITSVGNSVWHPDRDEDVRARPTAERL